MSDRETRMQCLAIAGGNVEQAKAAYDWLAAQDKQPGPTKAAKAERVRIACSQDEHGPFAYVAIDRFDGYVDYLNARAERVPVREGGEVPMACRLGGYGGERPLGVGGAGER